MEKFVVLSRYEAWTSSGKQFTKWFVINTNPLDEETATEYIKNQKINFDFIDKKTKLKHEKDFFIRSRCCFRSSRFEQLCNC